LVRGIFTDPNRSASFLFVAMVNEYHIANNAKQNSIKELTYKAKYLSEALNFVGDSLAPLVPLDYDGFVDNLASNSQSHVSIICQ
jgi:hypothetical protein